MDKTITTAIRALGILLFAAIILIALYLISQQGTSVKKNVHTASVVTPVSSGVASSSAMGSNPVSSNEVSTTSITISGPWPHNGVAFWGNDPTQVGWSASYAAVAPTLFLYNSLGATVFSKSVDPEYYGGNAVSIVSLPANKSFSTGVYTIAVCDTKTIDSITRNIVCGVSTPFTIIATSTAFIQ